MELVAIAALTVMSIIVGFALALIVLKRSSVNFVGDGSQELEHIRREIEQVNQRIRVSENRLDSMDRRLTDLSGRVT